MDINFACSYHVGKQQWLSAVRCRGNLCGMYAFLMLLCPVMRYCCDLSAGSKFPDFRIQVNLTARSCPSKISFLNGTRSFLFFI